MKHIYSFILVLLVTSAAVAQQEQQYTQYMVNPYVLNPAVGGTEDFIDVKAGYRTQWVNLVDAPQTYYLSGHSTLGKQFGQYHHHHEHKSWHGVGGYVYKDVTGPLSRTTLYASYAFNMPLTRKIRLSLGVFAGMKQFQIKPNWNAKDQGDVALLDASLNKLMPDASLGFWLYSKDYYVGGSAFQLLRNNISFDNVTGYNGVIKGVAKNHFYITGGYRFPLSDKMDFVPSFMVKKVTPTPYSVDVNGKVKFNDMVFAGLSYRVRDSFSGLVGVVLMKKIEVSYSYDFTTSALRKYSAGTHEIIIGYRARHPKHIDCPSRFW